MNQAFRRITVAALALALVAVARSPQPAQRTTARAMPAAMQGADPFLWLEDKDGARALAWVRAQNARSLPILERDSHYRTFYAQALAINQSEARIPYPEYLHGAVYNFWQDARHVRGIWRRTTLRSYGTAAPAWTTVLDLDALSKRERANWVWKGADCAQPQERFCMISLSDGGEDAVTLREFDLDTGKFVAGGFTLPRAKQSTAWLDADTLLVSRPWTADEVTASGYPYDVRVLKRGAPLTAASELFRGSRSDVSVDPFTLDDGAGHHAAFVSRGLTFFTTQISLLRNGALEPLNLPQKLNVQGMVDGRLLISLNQPWQVEGRTLRAGSLVAIALSQAQTDPAHLHPSLVYAPGPRESIAGVAVTKHHAVVTGYENVRGRAYVFTPNGSAWVMRRLALPDNASINVASTSLHGDGAFLSVTSFLLPTTLYFTDASRGTPQKIKSMPAQFDASQEITQQYEATSKDGTKIPYFVVRPKNMRFDGSNPTVLTAYGGFQISETPYYSGTIGKLWLERGGVFVLANIRGGGEFGPAWHEAGLKTHRQRIYDDFYAVGKDLVARRITDPRHLGIVGGSNGGLLMGVEFTQHPDMWNAVQIEVPLLDMLRYEKIQAGASWVGEYGSVSVPAERAFLEKISPYQNLRAGVAYPEPFIWTTTKDDRVGPQHARKFAAKLAAMRVPYLYYEVIEGGHGAGANLKESARTAALGWTYFTMKLME